VSRSQTPDALARGGAQPDVRSRSFPRRYFRMTPDLKAQIADEICTALERLGADEELLSVIGSWRDTLDDAEVLTMLRDYNATGKALHRPH